ncbi:cation-transporting ATPase [Agreia sp. COWG]|uniref:cation-transporting ATPase n=1 Tax=Agreia sp. COWG TaxID=2773266 RepID=UPI001927D4BB|nr:cation-transporting ATPase [Agreia sp. COWG]CAD6009096.1 conserved exported protein of unknown function [Agreia sp. COWG]
MSNLQRLLNMASKALDKTSQPSSASGAGKTDWRDLVRTAADKVTGDARPATGSPSPSRVQDAPVRDAPAAPVQDAPAYGTPPQGARVHDAAAQPTLTTEDRAAIARYDYLLKTAQPEQLEQVHRDAFARLTPAQRAQVETRLRDELPASEQPISSQPDDLARAAVRGEAHKPGFLRGLFAKPGARGAAGAAAGLGVGAVAGAGIGAAGGLLAAVAGGAVLSSFAAPLLEQAAGLGVDFDSLAGGLEGSLGGLDGSLGGLEGSVGDLAAGAGEQVTGLGEQVGGLGEHLSGLGSNFEIPGLGNLGGLFGRD